MTSPSFVLVCFLFGLLVFPLLLGLQAVQDAVAQEAQANQLFQQALQLSNEKRYREALDICKQVLTIRATHLPALQLKADLEKTLRAAGTLRAAEPTTPAGALPAPATIPGGAAPAPAR
jgi:hypothetical protein